MQNKLRVLKWQWRVERAFAWLNHFRKISKEYEMSTSSAKAFIQLASTKIILNRLEKCFT